MQKVFLKMFSFEAHVKLLSLFAIIVPLIFLVMMGCVRFWYYSSFATIPKWIHFLNRDVLSGYDLSQDLPGSALDFGKSSYDLTLAIIYYSCVTCKVILGIFLWKATTEKHLVKLYLWILFSASLNLFGFFMLSPMSRHRVLDIGLAVVYTKISAIYSAYTLIVVILLILKIKHINLIDPPESSVPAQNIQESLV